MLVTDYLNTVRENGKGGKTFEEVLSIAKTKDFPNKEQILTHFENVSKIQTGDFVLLYYDKKKMFKMKWNEFYSKSRGIVFNWKTGELMLYPFDKFFELGEHEETSIGKVERLYKEAEILEMTEKIDGSMISVRYFPEKDLLLVSSSQRLEGPHVEEAHRQLNGNPQLLSFVKAHPQYTFVMEMKTKEQPQLIKYGKDELTIIGMRDMTTFEMLTNQQMKEKVHPYGDFVVQIFEKKPWDELMEHLENPSTEEEGFVVRIGDLMVKFKSKNFILAARFANEPERNFNMVIQTMQEGRIEAMKKLVSSYHLPAFEAEYALLSHFLKHAREKAEQVYHEIMSELSKRMKEVTWSAFASVSHQRCPEIFEQIKQQFYGERVFFIKDQIRELRKYSEYFLIKNHKLFAQMKGMKEQDVLEKIKSGEYKVIYQFEGQDKKPIYMLPIWQFLPDEVVQYRF